MPYDINHTQFINQVKNISTKNNAVFVNLERLIPNNLGQKGLTNTSKDLEIDFMHFNSQGHIIFGNSISELLEENDFNSLTYILFLIIIVSVYWSLSRQYKLLLLLFSSVLFYGFWDFRFVPLLFISIFTDYYFSLLIEKSKEKTKENLLNFKPNNKFNSFRFL